MSEPLRHHHHETDTGNSVLIHEHELEPNPGDVPWEKHQHGLQHMDLWPMGNRYRLFGDPCSTSSCEYRANG